jgi:glutamate-ammonia-ligase adenylyltransferase
MAAVSSSSPDWPGALARAHAHSPFLSRALERLPDLESLLEAGDIEAALLKAKAAGEALEDTGVSLRRERLALATALAIGESRPRDARAFDLCRPCAPRRDRRLHRAPRAGGGA